MSGKKAAGEPLVRIGTDITFPLKVTPHQRFKISLHNKIFFGIKCQQPYEYLELKSTPSNVLSLVS